MYYYAELIYGLRYNENDLDDSTLNNLHKDSDLKLINFYDEEDNKTFYFLTTGDNRYSSESPPFLEEIDPTDLADITAAETTLKKAISDYKLPPQKSVWHLYADHT